MGSGRWTSGSFEEYNRSRGRKIDSAGKIAGAYRNQDIFLSRKLDPMLDPKNVKMLTAHRVFSEAELHSRCEIMLENYCKSVVIEANTMIRMARSLIAPAVEEYAADVAGRASVKMTAVPGLSCRYEKELIEKLSDLTEEIDRKAAELETAVSALQAAEDFIREAAAVRDGVLVKMDELRDPCDRAELLTAKKYWPFPTYADLLFSDI